MTRPSNNASWSNHLAYRIPQVVIAILWTSGAVGSILKANASMEVFHRLGYPDYFAQMLGAAQLLAVAAILLPVPVTLTEWAYAGLAFDSAAAMTSLLAAGESPSHLLLPLTAFILVITSYRAWRKRLSNPDTAALASPS